MERLGGESARQRQRRPKEASVDAMNPALTRASKAECRETEEGRVGLRSVSIEKRFWERDEEGESSTSERESVKVGDVGRDSLGEELRRTEEDTVRRLEFGVPGKSTGTATGFERPGTLLP